MQHSPCKIELDDLLAWRQHAAAVDLSSRRRVLTDLAGTHLSGFRGRGMEFEEHRVYQPGDEVRSMDWRVTARTGEPHIRLYREERERPVILVADLRATMQFGTRGCFKSVLAARALALCAWSAMANGDRVGGLVLDGQREQQLRSAGGRRGVLQLMHALCDVQPRLEHTLTLAALTQALTRMLWRLATRNQRWRIYDPFLVSENRWRAQRYGSREGLIDLGRGEIVPMAELVEEIVELIFEDAQHFGALEKVERAQEIVQGGTSATRQRRVYVDALEAGEDPARALQAVVRHLVDEYHADL